MTSGPRGMGRWTRRACALAALPPAPPQGPVPSEGEPHVTIAPAEPASVDPSATPARPDGPGTALLRTLTELTADLPDADPGRVAAAALRGRVGAGRRRDGAARAGHGGGRRAHLRGPRVLAAGRPSADASASPRRPPRQGVTSFTESVAVGHREGLIADRTAEFVRAPRGPPRRARRPRGATTASATSACAPCTAATCSGTRSPARSSRRPSTSCCGSPPASPRTTRARAVDEVAALYRPDEPPRLPSLLPHPLQLRHPAPADVVLLPPRLPAGRAGLHLRPLPPGRPPVEARRRHRPLVLPCPRRAVH